MATPQSKIITQILDLVGAQKQERTQKRAILKQKSMETLKLLKASAAQARKQGPSQQAQKQKKTTTKRSSIPKALLQRSRAIKAAIKRGDIAVKQGIAKHTDYKAGTATEKHKKFVAKYKGDRVSKRKKGGAKRQSVKKLYAQVQGQKYPYYLSKGYSVKGYKVGGGARGPGTIRAIAGSGAVPFRKLALAEQRKVAAFLNAAGKNLRSKGAKAQADLAEMQKVAKAKAQKRAGTGSSNWW